MKGFTDKALILFPELEGFDNEVDQYKIGFNVALANLQSYMKQIGVKLYAFYTDDYARLRFADAEYIQTLNTAERFFCLNNVDGMKNVMQISSNYDDERHMKLCKKSISQDMDIQEQFEILVKNDKTMCNSYIKEFGLVLEFAIASKSRYNINVKRIAPGHLHLIIKPGTFVLQAYMGPYEVDDLMALTGLNYACRPLTDWEGLC